MATESYSEFADLLRRARMSAGLTQEELAEAAGVSARAVSNLERGINRYPHRYTRDLLAEALHVSREVRAEWDAATRRHVRQRQEPSADGASQVAWQRIPIAPGPILGREGAIERVVERLRTPDVRLVTITGTGGTGKTRLALSVAEALMSDYAGGVYFIELAPVRDHDAVPLAVAIALGIRDSGGQSPAESLTTFLSNKQALLVLDNFEHVLPAASMVADLLSTCPDLSILVTSRAPLRLSVEHEITLPALAIPDRNGYTADQLRQFPSVTLFTQRASMTDDRFELTDQNAADVAAICQRLEGLPLAIELAAARIKLLPPRALLERLEQCLSVTSGGAIDRPERQRTLRDTVNWSYELLPEHERELFRQLSVFAGGWTLEGAEALMSSTGDLDVIDGLTTLTDHHLVHQVELPNGSVRFRMLEIIREHAFSLLDEEGNSTLIRRRHAEYFTALVEDLGPRLFGSEQIEVLNQLEQERANIHSALAWLFEIGDVETALRLAGSLWRFWSLRGPAGEGRRWYAALLSLADDQTDPEVRATALTGAGHLAERQHDMEAARTFNEQALQIWRTFPVAEQRLACWSLVSLGNTVWITDTKEAAERYDEAFALAEALEDDVMMSRVLFRLGNFSIIHGAEDDAYSYWNRALELATQHQDFYTMGVAGGNIGILYQRQGVLERARSHIEEAIAIHRRLGNRYDIANLSANLVSVELRMGNLDDAAAVADHALDVASDLGDSKVLSVCYRNYAGVLRHREELESALAYYQEAMRLARDTADLEGIVPLLEDIARLQVDRGNALQAVTFIAAAAQLREDFDYPRPPGVWRDVEKSLQTARDHVSAEQFSEAWKSGETMPRHDAIDLALSLS